MGIREDLKDTLQKHLGDSVSAVFLDKSLAIINESAQNKESLIAAADKICKRIKLFIDENLAQTIFQSLKLEIEKRSLPHGTKRRYPRVSFRKKVRIGCDGSYCELDADNLSEGGMYIKTDKPFSAGSKLEITLSLGIGKQISVTGVVVYRTSPLSDTFKLPPGMAIMFERIGSREIEMLRDYIQVELQRQ